MIITKNNISIYQEGNSTKRSILFVHGFPYDHLMWENQVKYFSKNFYCITYDIRGLGKSPAGCGQFTMESFVDDLEFIIDELKINKPILCGLSMGGYISLRAVERFENKLGGLILCDTKSEADDNENKLRRAAGIKQINTEGVEKFVVAFIANTFSEESIKKLGKQFEKIVERSSAFDPVGIKGSLLAMIGRNDTTAYLQNIKLPVLVLCGEKDKSCPPESMKRLADKIKGSEFVIIPNSGHMTPVENPDAVNKAIENFLNRFFN
jgi:pimeloyl-ACP methyl ester carboxylesterase